MSWVSLKKTAFVSRCGKRWKTVERCLVCSGNPFLSPLRCTSDNLQLEPAPIETTWNNSQPFRRPLDSFRIFGFLENLEDTARLTWVFRYNDNFHGPAVMSHLLTMVYMWNHGGYPGLSWSFFISGDLFRGALIKGFYHLWINYCTVIYYVVFLFCLFFWGHWDEIIPTP